MKDEIKEKMLEVAKILFLNEVPKEQAKYIGSFIEEQNKEIERLNNIIKQKDNIIDELEKSILQKLEFYKNDKEYFIDEKTMEDLYKELKDLKEGKQ